MSVVFKISLDIILLYFIRKCLTFEPHRLVWNILLMNAVDAYTLFESVVSDIRCTVMQITVIRSL